MLGLAARALDDPELSDSIGEFVAAIADDALANSLGAKLVQLTMAGVPDIYQGCELSGLSLVDPDNRRPVDFARRRALLADLDAEPPGPRRPAGRRRPAPGRGQAAGHRPGAAAAPRSPGVVRRRLRPGDRRRPGRGPCARLRPRRPRRRGPAVTVATRLPVGLRARGGWSDTVLPLAGSARGWLDVLTGAVFRGDSLLLGDVTGALPVALLVPEGE